MSRLAVTCLIWWVLPLCAICAEPQSRPRPQLPSPLTLLNTSSTDALAGNFRAALVKAMPSPLFEDARGWGHTKEVAVIRWRGQGLAVHPVKVLKAKKDGDWRKVQLHADNLADTLVFDLRNLQATEPGSLTFTIFLSFDARVDYDHQKWDEGLKLWDSSLQARLRVKLTLDCEVSARLDDKGELLPEAVLRVRATKADLKYDNLVVEHIAGVGGAAAKLMGETAQRMMHEFKPQLERDLLAKADAAIIKAADTKEVHVRLGDLVKRKSRP